jgi:hypothetical protein
VGLSGTFFLAAHDCLTGAGGDTHHTPPAAAHIHKGRFVPVNDADCITPAGLFGPAFVTDTAEDFVNFEHNVAACGAVRHLVKKPFCNQLFSWLK